MFSLCGVGQKRAQKGLVQPEQGEAGGLAEVTRARQARRLSACIRIWRKHILADGIGVGLCVMRLSRCLDVYACALDEVASHTDTHTQSLPVQL